MKKMLIGGLLLLACSPDAKTSDDLRLGAPPPVVATVDVGGGDVELRGHPLLTVSEESHVKLALTAESDGLEMFVTAKLADIWTGDVSSLATEVELVEGADSRQIGLREPEQDGAWQYGHGTLKVEIVAGVVRGSVNAQFADKTLAGRFEGRVALSCLLKGGAGIVETDEGETTTWSGDNDGSSPFCQSVRKALGM